MIVRYHWKENLLNLQKKETDCYFFTGHLKKKKGLKNQENNEFLFLELVYKIYKKRLKI